MKDIYSPLEIDEQWDQRAPMVEGDAFDAMVQMAPDDASGGGVATMEPTASNAVEQPIATTTAPVEPAQGADGMMPTPDVAAVNTPEQSSDTLPPASAEVSTEATTPTVAEAPPTDDQSVASLEGQQVATEEDPTQPPQIIPEPQPLPEVPTDAEPSIETPEAPAGDAAPEDVQPEDAMPHTVPPIEEYQPDPGNERPTTPDADKAPASEGDADSTPAPAEDVKKLDQAVAELPTSPTNLVVEKEDTEDKDADDDDKEGERLVAGVDDKEDGDIEKGKDKKPDAHRKQAVEALESNIADLKREVKEKEKLKRDHEDRRAEEERKISDLQAEIDFKKSEIAAFENAKAALTE